MITKLKELYDNDHISLTIAKISILSLLMLFSLKISALVYVMLAVAIAIVVTEKEFNGIYYCFLLINYRFIFRNHLDGSISFVLIVLFAFAIAMFVKYYLIRKEKLKLNWWVVGFSGAYLLYLLLPIHEFHFMEYLKFVVMVFTINFLVLFKDKVDLKKLILFFTTGCLIASFIFAITQIWFRDFFITMGYEVSVYGLHRYRGLAGDPNYYSVDLLISMAGIYYLYFRKQLNIYWTSGIAGVLAVFCWLTYSKSVLVGIVIMLALTTIASYVKDFKKNWYKPLILIGALFVGMIITNYVFRLATLSIFSRFQEQYTGGLPEGTTSGGLFGGGLGAGDKSASEVVMDNVLTGRWSLWGNHLKYSFSSLKTFLFGGGIGSYIGPMEAHNTAIQILYETGFVGAVLLAGIFVCVFIEFGFGKHLFKRENWLNWVMMIACVAMFMNVNYLAATSFVYHIFMFVFVLFDAKKSSTIGGNENVDNIHTDI